MTNFPTEEERNALKTQQDIFDFAVKQFSVMEGKSSKDGSCACEYQLYDSKGESVINQCIVGRMLNEAEMNWVGEYETSSYSPGFNDIATRVYSVESDAIQIREVLLDNEELLCALQNVHDAVSMRDDDEGVWKPIWDDEKFVGVWALEEIAAGYELDRSAIDEHFPKSDESAGTK